MAQYTKQFFDLQKDASYASAQVVVPIVLDLVHPNSVVDVGCGVGTWLAVFKDHGVKEIFGVDGKWVDSKELFIPSEYFTARDLEEPFDVEVTADMVSCLETAEHVSESASEGLVSSLVKIAPVVLFSAAIPLQEGVHHVNEQWPQYWANKFAKHGYVPVDCIRRKVWEDKRVRFFYSQNMFIYVKKEHLNRFPALEKEILSGNDKALAFVHPEKYLQAIERYNALLPVLKLIPTPIKKTLGKFLRQIRRKKLETPIT
jgi:SAM-dependent methyltransferase